MRRLALFLSLIGLALQAAAQNSPAKPPLAPVHAVTTTYFGVDVADPYRYMENLNDRLVKAWIGQQSEHARSVLDDIPGRAELLTELNKIASSEPGRLGRVVVMPGDRYFYLKQAPGRDFFSLYRRDSLTGKETLLIDPRVSHFGGGADSRIRFFSPSFNGSYILYGISSASAETTTIRVLNAETDDPLPDAITGVQYPIGAWLPDGRSFLYCRSAKPQPGNAGGPELQGSRIYMHRLGSDPSGDTPVFGAMAPKGSGSAGLIRSIETAPGSNYAVAAVEGAEGSLILYAAPIALGSKAALAWKRIGNDMVTILDYRLRGNQLFLLVNGLEGPVVARVPLPDAGVDNWGLMLQLTPAETATGIQAANDAIYLTVRDGGHSSLIRLPYGSSRYPIRAALPFEGNVSLLDEDPRVDGALALLSSWTRAPVIYRYASKSDSMVRANLLPAGPDDHPSNLVATEATALGSDGTLVPLTILYEKGLQFDGTHPTLLVGYGYRSSAAYPTFRPNWLVWLNRGGVIAFAHVGGEGQYGGLRSVDGLGVNWAGRYRDFLTCARYLVNQGYTTPNRLAAIGESDGGILVGRAITADPGLFRAAVIVSGWLDPLRFEDVAAGSSNAPQFGSAKTLAGFRKLQSLSSYDYVEPGVRYPAVLLEAGMQDEPSPAWQSAKMAARLSADTTSGLPILLNVERGRIGGQPFGALGRRDLFADEISFLLWQLGEPGFQPAVPTTTATR
jgi:prolyl oligopeptidase